MNVTKQDLIRLIKEEMLEPETPKVGTSTRLSKVSIDDQIDGFLLNYEMMSLREAPELEDEVEEINEALTGNSLSVLFEAEDDDAETAPPDDLGEEPSDEPVGDEAELSPDSDDDEMVDAEDVEVDEPEEEPVPLIDIDQFTQRVARLATRPDHLLDLESVIVNRALKFLKDNYTDSHVEKAQEILSNNFDFDFDTRLDDEDEIPPAFGSGTGGAAGGGLGGGGA
jgi:hypothetical protein